jgi:hypothetical protein
MLHSAQGLLNDAKFFPPFARPKTSPGTSGRLIRPRIGFVDRGASDEGCLHYPLTVA